MTGDEIERYISEIIKEAKVKSGMSISRIAEGVGRDDKTVSNWVKGKVTPNVSNLIRLFQVMEQPLLSKILPIVYPHLDRTRGKNTVDQKRKTLADYISQVAFDSEVEKLYFLTFGPHGSSWYPQLEEWVALDHLPMKEKVNIAKTIENAFDMAAARDELVATEEVMPEMDVFKHAIEQGILAAMDGRNAYNTVK